MKPMKRIRAAACAVLMAVSSVTSVMPAFAEDDEQAQPVFGSQFFVMGDNDWNWQSSRGYLDDNSNFVITDDAAAMAARSRTDNDTAIGDSGFQLWLDNPYDYGIGTVVYANCRLTVENEGDAVFPEPIEKELAITVDNHDEGSFFTASISLFPYGTDWAELEKLGEFTITAELSNVEVDTSNVVTEPEPEYYDGPTFGSQFYVMGNDTWNWVASDGYFSYYTDRGIFTISANAAALAELSRTETDTAIGTSGVQVWLDNPYDYPVGTVVSAKCRLLIDEETGQTEIEKDVTFTVEDHKKDHYPSAKIELYPEDTDWAVLEELGEFTINGEIYDIEVDTSNARLDTPRFGGQFFVMGDNDWNWVAKRGYFDDDNAIEISDNATDMAARSRTDNDAAIGDSGFQVWLDNPSEYPIGTVVNAKCHIVFANDRETNVYDPELSFTVEDHDYDHYPVAGFSFFPYGTDWEALDDFGEFTLTAELSDVEVDTSNAEQLDPEPEPEPEPGPEPGPDDDELYCDGFYYVVNEKGEAIITRSPSLTSLWTGTLNSGSILRIPKELDGHPVTDIEKGAFSNGCSVTKLIINADIPRLTRNMFLGLSAETIIIKGNVEAIDGYTFVDEALKKITVPATVTEIGERAFGYHLEYGADEYDYSYYYNPGFMIACYKDSAAQDYAENNSLDYYNTPYLEYEDLKDGTIVISQYDGPDTEINIPSKIGSKDVTWIYAFSFAKCSNITEVTIPETVTKIGDIAFCGCEKLKSIVIPKSVTEISSKALGFRQNDNWEYEKIPGFKLRCYAGTAAEQYAIDNEIDYELIEDFEYTELEGGTLEITRYNGTAAEVVIPEEIDGKKVTSIGSFDYCTTAESISIPAGVTNIKSNAFSWCISLKSLSVDHDNPAFSSEDGVLYNKQKTALLTCPWKKEEIVIPKSVESIGASAFFNCYELKSLTIPEGVSVIGEWAFCNCSNIENFSIPDSVTVIGQYAFSGCWNKLKNITLPSGIKAIPDGLFGECSHLTNAVLPDGITSIGDHAFWECQNLESIIIPEGVTSIGEYTFVGCTSLKCITVPKNVTNIGTLSMGFCYDEDYNTVKVPGFKLRCYAGTAAEQYAIDNEIDYELIEDNLTGNLTLHTAGSTDLSDTVITVEDADGAVINIALAPDGSFSSALPAGKYTVTVKKKGYPAMIQEITAMQDTPLNLSVELYQYGDSNKDSKVNLKDLVILKRYLNKWGIDVNLSVCDLNNDGKVNLKDLVLLQRYLNKWNIVFE